MFSLFLISQLLFSNIFCIHAIGLVSFFPSAPNDLKNELNAGVPTASPHESHSRPEVRSDEKTCVKGQLCQDDNASPAEESIKPPIKYDYIWTNLTIPYLHFQQSLCSYRCFNGRRTELDYGNENFKKTFTCFPCDCNKVQCERYGTCCPDVNEPYYKLQVISKVVESMAEDLCQVNNQGSADLDDGNQKEDADEDKNNSQNRKKRNFRERETIKCENITSSASEEASYLLIRSCPNDFPDWKDKDLCQEHIPNESVTRKTHIHVIDTDSNVVYFNEYCAKCNQVTKMIPWQLNIKCGTYAKVYEAMDQDEFLRLSLKTNSTCSATQSPPLEKSWRLQTCKKDWFGNPVSQCNVTGLWEDYDRDIEDACHMLDGHIHRVQLKGQDGNFKYYKNVFCMKCNVQEDQRFTSENPADWTCGCSVNERSPGGASFEKYRTPLPPYSLLFGFEERSQASLKGNICSEEQWEGPDESCSPLLCSNGKSLHEGKCQSNLDQIRGLPYTLLLWLRRVDQDNDTHYHTHPIPSLGRRHSMIRIVKRTATNYVRQLLNPLTKAYTLRTSVLYNDSNIGMDWNDHPQGQDRSSLDRFPFIHIDVRLYAPIELKRDAFEDEFLQILSRDQSAIHLELFPGITKKYELYITERVNKEDTMCTFLKRNDYLLNNPLSCHHLEVKIPQCPETSQDENGLLIHPQLICQYVQLNRSQVSIEEEQPYTPWTRTIVVDISEKRLEISGSMELNQVRVKEDGSIHICHELLKSKLGEYKMTRPNRRLMKLILDVETYICFAISIVCLLFTLITYILFPSLRCLAGIYNMFLCGSLILAQCLLVLAAKWYTTIKALCTAVGILTHSSWLWMFSWSFLCCYHMFRVFTAATRPLHGNRHSKSSIIMPLLASLVMPVLVVGVVIGTSLMTSQSQRTGYGRSLCYLDYDFMLASVVPAGVVTLANFTLFLVVVFKIWRVRSLQSQDSTQKERRRNFVIYVKLSTLTGMFMLTLIASEVLRSDPLRVIAVALNGLQGVFIFLSYTCNSRVLGLYRKRLGQVPIDKSTTIGTGVETTESRTNNN